MLRFGRAPAVLIVALCCGFATRVEGQFASGARFGVMAVGVVTRADPAYLGESLTEAYLTQPNMMTDVRHGALQFVGTLNFEGFTLRRGELNAGMYGEGYVDRRHPHTFVHEAVLSASSASWRSARFSLSAGKGFTPYGTDDPMMRPFEKYPVNHHHAQIIERAVAVGAVQWGSEMRGVSLEHGFFNGDEPVAPFNAPRWSRFGDSRATRLTVRALDGLEWQGSRAFVRSPGIVQGGAFDHVQTSTSVRFERPRMRRDRRYVLLEFARTDESLGQRRVFRFESALAEGLLEWHGASVALRGERTERPENERLLDPFRTQAGHIDFQILGVTRWTIGTLALTAPALTFRSIRTAHVVPFVEIARARPEARRLPTVFEPSQFYGSRTLWSLSAGIRLHAGTMRSRMGRYGVMSESLAATMSHGASH